MAVRLVVGLGNPGERYAGTRHNVGFMLVEAAREREGASYRKWKGLGETFDQETAAGKRVWARPLTYMNLSGELVRSLADFYKIRPSEVLVCYDDFALPLGKLRLRGKGSAGGHNGMQSVIDHLGTPEVPRLRVGIGPLPAGMDPADFVLRDFSRAESGAVGEALEKALAAVSDLDARGLEWAMSRHNAAEVAEP